jgi:hypothetical protein
VLLVLIASLFVVIHYNSKPKVDKAGIPGLAEVVKPFTFSDKNALKEWEEKVFKGKVIYTVVEEDRGQSYVKAESDKAASALYYKIKLDAKTKRPAISWKWRAEEFPSRRMKETLEAESEDDFAARVYVIFPALFFTNSKVLEYVWAKDLPTGAAGTSPYSKNIKIMVLESGPSKDWASEERDIYSDYVKMFGRAPEYNIGAVAFMTNSEHTQTKAKGAYDDIVLGYIEGGKP